MMNRERPVHGLSGPGVTYCTRCNSDFLSFQGNRKLVQEIGGKMTGKYIQEKRKLVGEIGGKITGKYIQAKRKLVQEIGGKITGKYL